MSMPKIPNLNIDTNINREDAINIIITSIAMEELALAHILNAEGEKLQYVLGTLEGSKPDEITICDIMAVNESIQKTLRDVIKAEMLLQLKLEDATEFAANEDKCQLTIKGRKIWRDSDNTAKKRPPTVTIDLLRDGEIYDSVDIDSMGDGAYSFKCLPVYKTPGIKYIYRVDETDVPTGYTKTVDGYNIINTIDPGLITIEVTKTWVGDSADEDARPDEITVNLFQNGVVLTPKQILKPPAGVNTSKVSFDNVPQFDNVGNLYVYTVDEEPIDDYKKSIDGFNITNTLNP